MAKIFRFEQLPVYVEDEIILADSAELVDTVSLVADHRLGSSVAQRIYGQDFPAVELRVTYLPSFQDVIYQAAKNDLTLDYNFAGITLNNGYVRSFSLNLEPQGLVKANANIVFYQDPQNKFNGLSIKNLDRAFIKKDGDSKDFDVAQGPFTKLEQNLVKLPLSLSYTFNTELFTRSVIGQLYPTEIRRSRKQIEINLQSEYLEKFTTMDGENASFKLFLRDFCDMPLNQKQYSEYVKYYYRQDDEPYTCDGKIQAITTSSAANDWAKSSINIVQFI